MLLMDIVPLSIPALLDLNFLGIAYLYAHPILHLVGEAARFSAARFLANTTTHSVWDAIVMCWHSIYTGLPNTMMVDEGSQFRKVFAELGNIYDVNVENRGIESHDSFGIVVG